MPIIATEFDYAVKPPFSDSEPARFKIDPNVDHQTPLPGYHKQYSAVFPKNVEHLLNFIQNFTVRADDIWIVGNPKSGTTWNLNIAFQLKNGLDTRNIAQQLEDLYFEKSIDCSANDFKQIQSFDDLPSSRVFKTHLPAFLLPQGLWTVRPKIIYTIRDPKDALVSEYHMVRNSLFGFKGTIDDYAQFLFDGTNYGAPVLEHLCGFLQLQSLDHILFVSYEKLLVKQFDEIKRISEFIGCQHTDDYLHDLVTNVSFKRMRKEFPSFISPEDKNIIPDPEYTYDYFGSIFVFVVNRNNFSSRFCRKGKAGTYKQEISEGLIQKMNNWIDDGLVGTGFEFD